MVAVVAAVALSVVAVAYGATRTQTERRAAGNGACGVLMNDPVALDAMQALRAEHQKERQAWYELYGSDPSSAGAQLRFSSCAMSIGTTCAGCSRNSGSRFPIARAGRHDGARRWRLRWRLRRLRGARRSGYRVRRHDGFRWRHDGRLELSSKIFPARSDAGLRDWWGRRFT